MDGGAPHELAVAASDCTCEFKFVAVYTLVFSVVTDAAERLAAVLALQVLVERWECARRARTTSTGGDECGRLDVAFVHKSAQPSWSRRSHRLGAVDVVRGRAQVIL